MDRPNHNILWLAIGGPRKGLPIAPRFQACDGHGACVILDRPETQPRGPIACRPASGAPGCILGAVCWRPWIDQTTTPRGYLSQVDTPFGPVGYPFDSGDHNILWLAIGGPRKGLPIAPRFQACDGHGACVILDRPETQPRGPIACRPASGAPGCILGAVCWRPWIDQTTTPRGYLSQVDTPFWPKSSSIRWLTRIWAGSEWVRLFATPKFSR